MNNFKTSIRIYLNINSKVFIFQRSFLLYLYITGALIQDGESFKN